MFSGHIKTISLEAITAQAFIFYIAGQETTGSTAAFTIYELAQYPELLKRLQDEVDETLAKNDGKITYDSLNKMEFWTCVCRKPFANIRVFPF